MILFFDTETTGLYNFRLQPEHPDQPMLVQLGMLACDDDGRVRSEISVLVNPRREISAEAQAVHGIDSDLAANLGMPTESALRLFRFYWSRADRIVAHNIVFDMTVMRSLWARFDGTSPGQHGSGDLPDEICTMNAAAPVLDLPPSERMVKAGKTGPKPPRLEECVKHFFGETLEGAHDALVDTRACRRVYLHLKREGHLT
jgi:DNA polymerase-3 subunit epsilon